MASGMTPISLPPSRAVKVESLRPAERCFHHVDNHSWVRKTQLEALGSSSAFHSSRNSKNSSDFPTSFTIMPASPREAAESLWLYIRPPPVSRPDESEFPAGDGAESRRRIRRDDSRDHHYSRTRC